MKKKTRPLNVQQARFVHEYMKDGNATQAAIRAGYSEKTAGQIGHRLVEKSTIRAAIDSKRKQLEQKLDTSRERIIKELLHVAFSDIRELYDDAGNLKPPSQWPDHLAASVAGLETEEKSEVTGEGDSVKTVRSKVRKVKRWEKVPAARLASELLGYLEERDKRPVNVRVEIVDPTIKREKQ